MSPVPDMVPDKKDLEVSGVVMFTSKPISRCFSFLERARTHMECETS